MSHIKGVSLVSHKSRVASKSLSRTAFLLAGLVAVSAFSPAHAIVRQARTADDFVDSIGFCLQTQIHSDAEWNTLKVQMGDMGIRYFRAGLEHVDDANYKSRFQGLYDAYGMKMLAIATPWGNPSMMPINGVSLSQIPDKVFAAKQFLLAVEGPNEPDIFWDDTWRYGGFTARPDQVQWYQNLLYDTIKADSRTSDVNVLTPALVRAESVSASTFNWINTKPLIKRNIIAWHYYNGRYLPTPYDTLNGMRGAYRSDSATEPAYLTEHGYRVRGDNFVSQKGQMKLNTRSMAFFFDSSDVNNNQKVFFYVAGPDKAAGEDYGFDNADYTPRPVYRSMKGVISYLKEATWNTGSKTWNRPNFTTGSLDYTVTGDNGDYGYRLLQKSNGDFYLIAVPYIQVTNPADGTDITNSVRNATITFAGQKKVAQYKCDDNGNYTETTLTNGATSVNVALDDTLMIFKISAVGATPSDGPNLVTNPGFETEPSTQTPSGWLETSGDVNASFTEGYGGAHGGSYHGTHYSNSAYTIYTYQTKTGLTNGLYTLKTWVRSGGGQGTCILEAKNFGGASRNVNIPQTSTWTPLTISGINLTNGQCTFGIWSSANAGNWCHFDDFEFYRQGNQTPIGQRIGFKATVNNQYVMSNEGNGSTLQALAGAIGAWEKFDVVDAGAGLIALRAVINGRYVSSDQNNSGTLKAAWATGIGSWETFSWQDLGNNNFALKANINGRYVSSDQANSSTLKAAWNNPVGSWETFNWVGGQ